MATFKNILQTVLFLAVALLFSGCNKPQEVDELKNELSAIRDRLSTLEAAQKKAVNNDWPPHLSEEQIVLLNTAIAQCVNNVRATAPGDRFYLGFEAYFNPGTGRVQNNAMQFLGGQNAAFAFNKCMVSQGWPLA